MDKVLIRKICQVCGTPRYEGDWLEMNCLVYHSPGSLGCRCACSSQGIPPNYLKETKEEYLERRRLATQKGDA